MFSESYEYLSRDNITHSLERLASQHWLLTTSLCQNFTHKIKFTLKCKNQFSHHGALKYMLLKQINSYVSKAVIFPLYTQQLIQPNIIEYKSIYVSECFKCLRKKSTTLFYLVDTEGSSPSAET